MASSSIFPCVTFGCEYGRQNGLRTKKLSSSFTSKLHRNFLSPHYFLHNKTFPLKTSKRLGLRATSIGHESNRPWIDFAPSPWTHHFLSVHVEDSDINGLSKEIEALKPQVRDMLLSSNNDVKERIHLIHLLDTLCLSYHFEDDIEAILKHDFENIDDKIADEDDLYTISIMFRVFRRHGLKMSCDIFERFRSDDEKFEQRLVRDVKGMLSLYEAAHMGTTAEDIMDEALSFTKDHLESLAHEASAHLARLIQNALYRPQHHNTELLVAREYISFYEQEDDHGEMLLRLAKLNFNYLQLHYNRELNIVTKWWEELNLASKLPYMRDRMAELYFWTTIYYFEPRFSRGRITAAKFLAFLTLLDDTFDAYGTLDEVTALVDHLERMDHDAIDKLQGYLKIVFSFMLDIFEELEQQARTEGKSYYVQYIKDELKGLVKADLQIAKWARNEIVPTFEEYMEVGKVTVAAPLALCTFLMGMGPFAGKEAFEWLRSYPKLVEAINLKGRLLNDITTFKDEMSRGEIATGINCYTKQYRVTEEEAFAVFRERVREVEKVVNEELLNTRDVPLRVLGLAINMGRLVDFSYKYVDEFTHPLGKIKDSITTLFVEPIPL